MAKVLITQIKSRIGQKPKTKATLDALGLQRNYRSVTLEETPQLKGMLRQVAHLVRVQPAKS
jgi:large subunit ribosomal protein L30